MTLIARPFLVAIAALAALLVAAPAAAADLILPAAGGHIVEARINGVPVRLRVDPETSGYIILNAEAAQRIGLRKSLLGATTTVGPVRLRGSTKVARVQIGDQNGRRRVVWTERQAAPGADGLIGPADMPFDKVTFELRPASAGEQTITIPMQWDRSFGLFHPITIGGQVVRFRISTQRQDSVSTAAAAAVIASVHGGNWSGEPSQQMIKYEIVRPIRPMSLARPILPGGLGLERFMVRTSDSRGSAVLPPEAQVDPDELVVTAERERQRARYDLSLGRDWLSGCSSITWDNRARIMALSCAPSPAPTS